MTNEHTGRENKMSHKNMDTQISQGDQTLLGEHDLRAMVASRICHDLISPMGAIGNGLELLQLSQEQTSPEMEMISQSIEMANSRLRLYRVAFGTVGDGQMMSRSEILSILGSVNAAQRHHLSWASSRELTRRQVKLAFLALMCVETALPWGGEITVSDNPSGLRLAGLADRIKHDDGLWDALTTGEHPGELTSARIQFGLAIEEARDQGSRFALEVTPTALTLDLFMV